MQAKKIKIRGKIIEVEVCKSIFSKFRGLMFRKNPRVLLFEFNKPTRQPIHSFFCKPFHAYWLQGNKVIDDKVVQPFRIYIRPKRRFAQLVEIPLISRRK